MSSHINTKRMRKAIHNNMPFEFYNGAITIYIYNLTIVTMVVRRVENALGYNPYNATYITYAHSSYGLQWRLIIS